MVIDCSAISRTLITLVPKRELGNEGLQLVVLSIVYFDNVGGALTDAAFHHLDVHARICVCGQIYQYNLMEPEAGTGKLQHRESIVTGLANAPWPKHWQTDRSRVATRNRLTLSPACLGRWCRFVCTRDIHVETLSFGIVFS